MGATGDTEQPRGPGVAERGGLELGDAGAAGQPVLTIPLVHADSQVFSPCPHAAASPPPQFFQKAALNVRDNVGEEVDAEQLIQEACRSCLEQVQSLTYTKHTPAFVSNLFNNDYDKKMAKLLFSDGEKVIPRLTHELPGIKRGRQAEEESHRGSPIPKKRKGRPPGHVVSNDRAAAGMVRWKPKSCEPIRREGPKWDPARLNESTTFVLGSRANKALGMGGTRGRIYIKHPHLFKYAADPQDKHWLAEQHHMRATGGKMVSIVFTCATAKDPTNPGTTSPALPNQPGDHKSSSWPLPRTQPTQGPRAVGHSLSPIW
ncbi:Deoxynucleotidyltransferase terminal-interacting protein 1 [Microtus ochrogaster]|uniref:Deoxynucleotidyltransferase terminal-interacting protein 1 n=1 Tax=Microtus ochrogaster TaxID=79684 RepID=A0A8J6KKQ9_MICOH|nr:Deoxynucleotidyltransferase terminal-interacting protein 1 [Microtus ochrogaster]